MRRLSLTTEQEQQRQPSKQAQVQDLAMSISMPCLSATLLPKNAKAQHPIIKGKVRTQQRQPLGSPMLVAASLQARQGQHQVQRHVPGESKQPQGPWAKSFVPLIVFLIKSVNSPIYSSRVNGLLVPCKRLFASAIRSCDNCETLCSKLRVYNSCTRLMGFAPDQII